MSFQKYFVAMKPTDNEIFSSRVMNYSVEKVYLAFEDPDHLKNWWGPNGFSNTIHEFDLRPGGKWDLTMHGPEVGNYRNTSEFKIVIHQKLVSWRRITQPYFDMEVGFEKLSETKTNISFRMVFGTPEECTKIRKFALPKNEENFDRLEIELENIK